MDISADTLFGFIQALFGGAFFLLWRKTDKAEVKAEKALFELQQYKVHIAETYVSHEHLDRQTEVLNKSLDEIKEMLAELRTKK